MQNRDRAEVIKTKGPNQPHCLKSSQKCSNGVAVLGQQLFFNHKMQFHRFMEVGQFFFSFLAIFFFKLQHIIEVLGHAVFSFEVVAMLGFWIQTWALMIVFSHENYGLLIRLFYENVKLLIVHFLFVSLFDYLSWTFDRKSDFLPNVVYIILYFDK